MANEIRTRFGVGHLSLPEKTIKSPGIHGGYLVELLDILRWVGIFGVNAVYVSTRFCSREFHRWSDGVNRGAIQSSFYQLET